MRILCLASCYPPDFPGGYGLVAQGFAEGLAARGHDVRVLTRQWASSHNGPVTVDRNNPVAVERTLYSIERGMSISHMVQCSIKNIRSIRRYIYQYHPDIILSCGSDGFGYNTYHAALRSGIPTLTYLGDTWLTQAWRSLPYYDPLVDFARGGRRPGVVRVVKKMAGAYLKARGVYVADRPDVLSPLAAISQFVIDDLRAAGAPVPAAVPIVHVPVHRLYYRGDGEPVGHGGRRGGPFKALFVSRVEPLKGPDVAVAALAAAVRRGLNATLTIAGFAAVTMRECLQQQARGLGVAERLNFAGTPALAALIEIYRTHDVFLFPSRIVEGLGMVNCEAQACGLPIIGTADSGAAEVIVHGETGFRVPRDDPEAMAAAMQQLAEAPELWQQMSAKALQSARRFHPDRVLDKLEAVIASVVRK